MIEREAQLAIERKKVTLTLTLILTLTPTLTLTLTLTLSSLVRPDCGTLRGTGGGAGAGAGAAVDAAQGGHDAAEDVARPQRAARPRAQEVGRQEGQGWQGQEEEVAGGVHCACSDPK